MVRQSAFALLGDLATRAHPLLGPHLQALIQALLTEIRAYSDETSGPAANNALWALGQIMRTAPHELLRVVAESVLDTLSIILAHERGSPLAVNAATALGWLATGNAVAINPANQPDGLIQDLCAALRGMRDDREKEDAFSGLVRVMLQYP